MITDKKFMQKAFKLAKKAEVQNEIPVGAVVVCEGEVVGEGWNQSILSNDPTAHAEIMALRAAGKKIANYRLPNATIYTTLEPCAMCAGAIIHARLSKLVYAVDDPKTGACGSVVNLLQLAELNHKVEIEKGVLEKECRILLQNFFRNKRLNKA